MKANEAASVIKSRQVLVELNEDIAMRMKSADYAKAGGFHAYQSDVNTLQNLYQTKEGLGIKVRS